MRGVARIWVWAGWLWAGPCFPLTHCLLHPCEQGNVKRKDLLAFPAGTKAVASKQLAVPAFPQEMGQGWGRKKKTAPRWQMQGMCQIPFAPNMSFIWNRHLQHTAHVHTADMQCFPAYSPCVHSGRVAPVMLKVLKSWNLHFSLGPVRTSRTADI